MQKAFAVRLKPVELQHLMSALMSRLLMLHLHPLLKIDKDTGKWQCDECGEWSDFVLDK